MRAARRRTPGALPSKGLGTATLSSRSSRVTTAATPSSSASCGWSRGPPGETGWHVGRGSLPNEAPPRTTPPRERRGVGQVFGLRSQAPYYYPPFSSLAEKISCGQLRNASLARGQ
jgi:hypothetical protein